MLTVAERIALNDESAARRDDELVQSHTRKDGSFHIQINPVKTHSDASNQINQFHWLNHKSPGKFSTLGWYHSHIHICTPHLLISWGYNGSSDGWKQGLIQRKIPYACAAAAVGPHKKASRVERWTGFHKRACLKMPSFWFDIQMAVCPNWTTTWKSKSVKFRTVCFMSWGDQ